LTIYNQIKSVTTAKKMILLSCNLGSLIGGIGAFSSRPMDFDERRENAVDILLANKPELDRPSSFFFKYRISPEKPVRVTSDHNPGKNGISPICCRPKEGQEPQKHKKAAALSFSLVACAGPLCINASYLAFKN
jgi:hypothetical protein